MAIRDGHRRDHEQAAPQTTSAALQPAKRLITGLGSITSRKSIVLASSTAWRTVASRRAGEPWRSSLASSRKNWIVLASRSFKPGPPLLDPHGDIEIGEPDEERPDDPLDNASQSAAPDERGQERRPDHEVEVKQPVGKARQDHQRHDHADHPRQPVESQEPPERTAQRPDSRFQLSRSHHGLPGPVARTHIDVFVYWL